MDAPAGERAIRIAIGIGRDAALDVLRKFVGSSKGMLLKANNSKALAIILNDSSMAGLKNAFIG